MEGLDILFILIIVIVGIYSYIRDLFLSYKQKKVIKIFKLYPNAVKACMLQKDEFTYYDKTFHLKSHNYKYIINTTEDIIKNKFEFIQCNAILEIPLKEYESWEYDYNYVIKIFEKYYDGLLNYIVNHKIYRYSVAPESISEIDIISLPPAHLKKLATVKECEYEELQNIENKFYIVKNPKEEATEIKKYIKENKIKYLYHFTDIRNIKSIISHGGLFSWYSAPQRGINIINPGGDVLSRSLDKRSNLEDYVRLSFTQWHPMMHKKEQEGAKIVVLKIHPSVAILHDTLFSNMNATSNMCNIGADLEAFKRINLEATRKAYVKRIDKDFAELQAEVLVKTHLPLKYILNINEFLTTNTSYYKGDGVLQDHTESAKWYRKAAEQGNAEAQNSLGNCYYQGQGVPQNYAEAVKWYRKAVEQGNAKAQFNLGNCYYNGWGVPKDYAEAAKWYRKSAEQGKAQAQFNLGVCYKEGQGVPQNFTEAVKWYRKAADQGDANAQYNLGICYKKGQGVPQNYTEAAKWYRKAAEQGDAKAQYNLGVCYAYGWGVPQNYAEAVNWCRKAAEQGDAQAQFNLGQCYREGEGVSPNYAEAVKWYRKAAEQGDATAQYNLGMCYFNGDGVPQDYTEAAKWWRKAAEQGDAPAQTILGLRYKNGDGVPQNKAVAIKWFKKAAQQGDEYAKNFLESIGETW